ncbi:MAG: sulfatase [Kiritimatiellae bacterium]|nr:sulfatase [Kiritimatiellia bacterium]
MGLWTAVCAAASAAAPQWNVLFVAVDDLRPELGCYGAPHVRSPNLDRLAREGMVFRRAYCQQAVCSPSRTSLMTGARPDRTRIYDLETHFRRTMGKGVVTLPQLFKNHGWFVQGMGKLYHGGLDDPASWSVPWSSPKVPHGTYALPENRAVVARKVAEREARAARGLPPLRPRDYGPAYECADVPDSTYHDGALADLAIAALRDIARTNRPFWLGVGFIRPHLPFVAPKKYWDLYDRNAIALAPNPFPPRGAPPYAVPPGSELRAYEGIPGDRVLPDELARTLKHGYYAALSYMDAQLGRVLDELERLGLRTNTIVVVWGDHGWKLGEHAAWCKHTNMELDTRVPLIVSVPGMRYAGTATDAIVEFVDIYPTLAELCGLPLPDHIEGTSFRPVLEDPTRPWKRAAFSQYPRTHEGRPLMGYSMRTERYRFTLWVDRRDTNRVDAVELYDHATDPQENENIAGRPETAELVRELTAQLRAGWRAALPPAQ